MNAVLLQDITKEWNLESLPEQKRKEVVNRISHILFQALLVRSLDILSQDEQDELDELLDTDTTTPDTVFNFLKTKIPTFDRLMKDERQNLRQGLLHAIV